MRSACCRPKPCGDTSSATTPALSTLLHSDSETAWLETSTYLIRRQTRRWRGRVTTKTRFGRSTRFGSSSRSCTTTGACLVNCPCIEAVAGLDSLRQTGKPSRPSRTISNSRFQSRENCARTRAIRSATVRKKVSSLPGPKAKFLPPLIALTRCSRTPAASRSIATAWPARSTVPVGIC